MKINIAIVGSTGNVGRKTVEALFIHLFQGNNSLPFLYGPLSLFPPSFTQIPRETRIAFLEKALPFLRTLPSFQERINKLEWLITQEDDVVF